MGLHFAKSGNLYRDDNLLLAVESWVDDKIIYDVRTIDEKERCSSLAIANFINGVGSLSIELVETEALVTAVLSLKNRSFVENSLGSIKEIEFVVEKYSISAIILVLCGCVQKRDYIKDKEVYSIDWS